MQSQVRPPLPSTEAFIHEHSKHARKGVIKYMAMEGPNARLISINDGHAIPLRGTITTLKYLVTQSIEIRILDETYPLDLSPKTPLKNF